MGVCQEVWILGAAGLAALPHLLFARVLSEQAMSTLLAYWVFGLVAAGLCTDRRIESDEKLDAQGRNVLRLAVRAAFVIWTLMMVGHVLWWSSQLDLAPHGLLLAACLLAALRMGNERGVWLAAAASLSVIACVVPASFSAAALMAAVVLLLRGWRPAAVPVAEVDPPAVMAGHPYRVAGTLPGPAPLAEAARPSPLRPEARRLYVGSVIALYLSVWTLTWQGGAWPQHHLWLDLPLFALLLFAAWRGRMLLPVVTMAAVCGHWAVQQQLVCAPGSSMQWGVLILACGFVLLFIGLTINWFARTSRRPGLLPRPDRLPPF